MKEETFRQGGARVEVRLYHGDTVTLRATLQDDNGDAIDLTTYTAYLHMKKDLMASTADFTITGSTVGAAANGIVDFAFTTTQTADVEDYTAEIELETATNVGETIAVFDIHVLRDVG